VRYVELEVSPAFNIELNCAEGYYLTTS